MRLRIFLLLIVFILVDKASAQNKIKWSSWQNAADKIQKADKKFLIYFYLDECKWCRYMEETTFAADHIARFINQNFYPYRVNAFSKDLIIADKNYATVQMGKYEFHELAVELLGGDMSFPSIVFMNENFQKLANYESYLDTHNFEMILSYYAGEHYRKTVWRRYASNYCRDSHFNSLVSDKH